MSVIKQYFPDLSENQYAQFAALPELYRFWNEQINVISRKDIDNFEERHVLHSLGIVQVCRFQEGVRVIDVGTGGGFPGIPLAIFFPETEFILIDSIGKKIKVVKEVAEAVGLKNVTALHTRAEDFKAKAQFVVSRAVTRLEPFIRFTQHLYGGKPQDAKGNRLLYLKGGDLAEELAETGRMPEIFWLKNVYKEEFFETKAVVSLRF